MTYKPLKIFISSVQKELEQERKAVKAYLHDDPLMKRFFDAFLFEDMPAKDRRADKVYLEEVGNCDVYIGLFGNEYGAEDKEGISPTEREFDHATIKGKARLVFIKGTDNKSRHPKMLKLIRKAGSQLIRRRFFDIPDLIAALYASLVEYLEQNRKINALPFDASACPRATIDDISEEKLGSFLGTAKRERNYVLSEKTTLQNAMTHLKLFDQGKPTHAAILLFGKDPQRFLITSEVKCLHYHGTEVRKPIPSIPHNPLLAEPLYLARYIEKAGSGTLDMIDRCREAGLPEPGYEQRGGQWVVTLWRDWLTEEIMADMGLNDRQKKAIQYLKINKQMTNNDYQHIASYPPRTATRDLNLMVLKGIIKLQGRGRGAQYFLIRKRVINAPNAPTN